VHAALGFDRGIASGKSTVAAMLREQGFPVIEADRISHRLIEKDGAAYTAVVGLLGESILDQTRALAGGQVAAIVFNDRDKLRQLERDYSSES